MLERRSPVHPVKQDLLHPLYPQSQVLSLPALHTPHRPLIPLVIIMLWIQVGHLMQSDGHCAPSVSCSALPCSPSPSPSTHLLTQFQRIRFISPLSRSRELKACLP